MRRSNGCKWYYHGHTKILCQSGYTEVFQEPWAIFVTDADMLFNHFALWVQMIISAGTDNTTTEYSETQVDAIYAVLAVSLIMLVIQM